MIYKRLGQLLVREGLISRGSLDDALAQRTPERNIDTLLVEAGLVTRGQITRILREHLGVEPVELDGIPTDPALGRLIPRELAEKYQAVPVRLEEDTLYLAMADPLNYAGVEALRMALRRRIVPMLASAEAVTRRLQLLYGSESAEQALRELEKGEARESSAYVIGSDPEEAPTVRLVNSFLEYGVNQNASDIHLEPREGKMAVQMRLDGQLRRVFEVPETGQAAVIARIKVMGNMNVAEHKLPLDGRCSIRVGETEVDLRISTVPTVHGEKAVIRLLKQSGTLLSPEGIGLAGRNLEKYNALLENANGVILLVGPTGSGKSSTMYTMLHRLNREEVNLVALEDPVEYHFDGVNQVQINEKTGMTFASGLRAVLRQDPDIIAVGEIRDGETADIAMRAAITGHLVLSTLHTNDAPSAIDRLLDMGVADFLISAALKGVVSQRLVRKICPHCREGYVPTAEEQCTLGLEVQTRTFYRGKGCPRCFHTGYRGRTAAFEILMMNGALRRGIADGLPRSRLVELMEQSDYEPLRRDCARLVLEGVTTAAEACRAVHSTAV